MINYTEEQLNGFRPNQRETIELIDEMFDKGYRAVLLDAPTGAGKSLINMILAHKVNGYITTPQVMLVDQMDDSIRHGGVYAGLGVAIKGKGNYPCKLLIDKNDGKYFSASGAPCKDCDWHESGCDYFDTVRMAQGSKVAITTLAYMLLGIKRAMMTENSGWEERDTLVVDEAHSLDDAVTNFFTVEVTMNSFDGKFNFEQLWSKVKECKDDAEIISVVKDHATEQMGVLREQVSYLMDKGKGRSAEDDEELVTLNRRLERIEHLVIKLGYTGIEYVVSLDGMISIKPYSPAPFISDFLHSFNRVLLSSATFVNPSLLMANLGFEKGEWIRVQVPSTFNAENAPIVFDFVGKMNRETMQSLKPEILKKVKFYMDNYDERMLIHCHSYDIANYLRDNLHSARVITHNSDNRNSAIKDFIRSKNGVFLSVNMTEGLDLHDDLCRFQVIVKAPYPNLADKWVKAHADRDGFKWYESKALLALIQASGRIVRNEKDRGVTVILDSNIGSIIKRNRAGISESFLERIKGA